MIITENKENWQIDVPVAVNFFARPDTFKQVFEVIRQVKPRQLFLIADGPRENVESDFDNCKACRDIAENVDWNCEVYHFYNDKNKGLWDTYFDAMGQVFRIVDRCIFLEDDVVVSRTFFVYCQELLDRYKDDLRISFVTGINLNGTSQEIDGDYFFCGEGALTAYGLWKRTFDAMNLSYCENSYAIKAMTKVAKKIKPGYEKRIKNYVKDPLWQGHIPHVEVYKNLLRFSENQLCIVPRINLVTNIGVCAGASHSAKNIQILPKASQVIFNAERFEYELPLNHPQFVINNLDYEKKVNYVLAWNRPVLKLTRRVEALLRHMIYGDFKRIFMKGGQLLKGDLKE